VLGDLDEGVAEAPVLGLEVGDDGGQPFPLDGPVALVGRLGCDLGHQRLGFAQRGGRTRAVGADPGLCGPQVRQAALLVLRVHGASVVGAQRSAGDGE